MSWLLLTFINGGLLWIISGLSLCPLPTLSKPALLTPPCPVLLWSDSALSVSSLCPHCPPPPPPCRVLIPQCGRVSEPEWDGDGGGLLMWRSAAAIATWGLLSFNQTNLMTNVHCWGNQGGGGRKGASVRGGAGWGRLDLRLLLFPPLWQEKKGSLLHQLITWAGEKGVRLKGRWVSSGTQKIKHLILN